MHLPLLTVVITKRKKDTQRSKPILSGKLTTAQTSSTVKPDTIREFPKHKPNTCRQAS